MMTIEEEFHPEVIKELIQLKKEGDDGETTPYQFG